MEKLQIPYALALKLQELEEEVETLSFQMQKLLTIEKERRSEKRRRKEKRGKNGSHNI